MTFKRFKEIAEQNGWSVFADEDYIELSQYTTRRQDFSFIINKNNDYCKEVYSYYEDFDPSAKAFAWVDSSGHGKNGAPYLLKDIVADMEEVEDMVYKLYESLLEEETKEVL